MPGNDDEKLGGKLQSVGPFLTLGLQLAVTVIVFFFIGRYADDKLGTKPWMMIAAIFIGSVGGMIKFFHTVMELSKKEQEHK